MGASCSYSLPQANVHPFLPCRVRGDSGRGRGRRRVGGHSPSPPPLILPLEYVSYPLRKGHYLSPPFSLTVVVVTVVGAVSVVGTAAGQRRGAADAHVEAPEWGRGGSRGLLGSPLVVGVVVIVVVVVCCCCFCYSWHFSSLLLFFHFSL